MPARVKRPSRPRVTAGAEAGASHSGERVGACGLWGRVGEALSRWAPTGVLSLYGLLLAPLFLACLSLPFGWWDWLTVPQTAWHSTAPSSLRELPAIYIYGAFNHRMIFRPNYLLIDALEYTLFGGQFWLWYIAKWIGMLLVVLLVWKLLERLGADRWCRIAAAGFLLFNPCRFELMLLTAECWACLGMLMLLFFLARTIKNAPRPFDVSGLSWPAYAGLIVLFWYAAWVKEISLAFAAVFLLFCVLNAGWRLRSQALLLPLWAIWITGVYRLYEVQKLAVHATANLSHGAAKRLLDMLTFGAGFPRQTPVALVLLVWLLVTAGALLYVRRRGRDVQALLALPLLGSFACVLFQAAASLPVAPRYALVIIALMAIPLGAALSHIRWSSAAAVAFALLFPFYSVTDVYGQYVAYQQRFYEQADILALLEDEAAKGYELAATGVSEMDEAGRFRGGAELEEAVHNYFGVYHDRYYEPGVGRIQVYYLATDGIPTERFALLTTYSPIQIQSGIVAGLDPRRIQAVYQIGAGGLGFLANVYNALVSRDAVLGINRWPTYDVGAPMIQGPRLWHVYEVGPKAPAGHGRQAPSTGDTAPEASAGRVSFPVITLTPRRRWGAFNP